MSHLTNSKTQYGWLSITLHWLLAVILIAMYFAGDYMVDLDYYDYWYHRAPQIHKEVGVIIGLLMVLRLLWNVFQMTPEAIGVDKPMVKFIAKAAHYLLYGLVFVIVVSGYLISTAKGQGIDIFGLFDFPVLFIFDVYWAELAADVHEWATLFFIILVGLHASAALLHHFVLKDNTLKRMLRVNKVE